MPPLRRVSERPLVGGQSKHAARETVMDIRVRPSVLIGNQAADTGDPSYVHSEEEWESYRSEIIEIYTRSHTSIFDVQDEMRRRWGFSASVRQYKHQLKKVNITKNMSSNTQVALGQLAQDAFDNQQLLPLRGPDGLHHQWHKVRRRDLDKGRRVQVREHFGRLQDLSGETDTQAPLQLAKWQQSQLPQLPRAATPPDDLLNNEFILHRITVFIPESSPRGMQDWIGSSVLYHLVRQLYFSLRDKANPLTSTRALLDGVKIEIERLVQEPSALLLMELINICGWNSWPKNPQLRQGLAQILFAVCQATNRTYRVQQLLGEIVPAYQASGVWQSRVWECLQDKMAYRSPTPAEINSSGLTISRPRPNFPPHAYAFSVYQVALYKFRNGAFQAAMSMLETEIPLAEGHFGVYSHWPRKYHLLSAVDGYERYGMFAEAKQAFEYAATRGPDPCDEITVRGLQGLLRLQSDGYPVPDPEKRITLAQKVFEASLRAHGAFDESTFWNKKVLHEILTEYGRLDDLARLERRWQREYDEINQQQQR